MEQAALHDDDEQNDEDLQSYIACLAIVGKEPLNTPLFVRVFAKDDAAVAGTVGQEDLGGVTAMPQFELKFHYYLYCALDVIDERLQAGITDKYLGLLCPADDYKMYAESISRGDSES